MKRARKFLAIIAALIMCLSVGFTVACDPAEKDTEEKTYTVTLPTGLTGGSVTADKTKVKAGENVVITATPDASYELDWLKINDESQTKTSDNKYEVKNVNKNIVVTASFKSTEVPSMFTFFPEDRLIKSFQDITYYVNAEGTEAYRNDLPTVVDGAQLGITVTMKAGTTDEQVEYLPDDDNYSIAGGVKENYSENGYSEGILTDVSDGIYMVPQRAYEIAYTASKDGKTETKIQTILVVNTYDLVSETFGPLYDDLSSEELINMTVVDAPSDIFGESKVMNLNCPAGQVEASGFFYKEGIYLGTKNTSDLQWVIYNDSDCEVTFAVKATAWPADCKIAPHSYMLWNPYSRPWFQTGAAAGAAFEAHGFIDRATGAMNMLQFTVVPAAGEEGNVYIGGLRGTAEVYTEFATFPEDRIISLDEMSDPYGLTYYVNESGEEEFRSDFPTAKNDTTEVTAKVTARNFRSYVHAQYGTAPTSVDEEQFTSGVLDDISEGIDMLPGYAYYIEYTATMKDGTTETRTQTIILHDMEARVADIFTDMTFTTANQVSSVVVEDSFSAILGTKMLNVTFDDHSQNLDTMRQVFTTKTGVNVDGNRETQRLEFLIYNPNDFAIDMFNMVGTNSSWQYTSIEPHTFILWDSARITGYAQTLWTDGLITEANELGTIAFYFRVNDGKAGNLYIGEYMATQPATAAA